MINLNKISAMALIAAVMFAAMPLALISTQSGIVQVTHLITRGDANPEATAKAKPAPISA